MQTSKSPFYLHWIFLSVCLSVCLSICATILSVFSLAHLLGFINFVYMLVARWHFVLETSAWMRLLFSDMAIEGFHMTSLQ